MANLTLIASFLYKIFSFKDVTFMEYSKRQEIITRGIQYFVIVFLIINKTNIQIRPNHEVVSLIMP